MRIPVVARIGLASFVALALGCAPTSVNTTWERLGPSVRPQQVIVYDFAVSPDEVQLNRGLEADVVQMAQGTAPAEDRIAIGHAAARAASETLVEKLNAMGMPAVRATGMPISWAQSAIVEGQFVSLSQGNSTERDVIGLGLGRSSVQARVQLYEAVPGALEKLETFTATAESGYKPGMAETLGAGAAAGHLAVSAAVSVAGDVASEALSDSVKADAQRLATQVADRLQAYFVQQGWIQPQ